MWGKRGGSQEGGVPTTPGFAVGGAVKALGCVADDGS